MNLSAINKYPEKLETRLLFDASNKNNDQIKQESADWINIIWMISIHLISIFSYKYFSWSGLYCCLALFFATGCLGITFCFHRLLSHKSFKTHPVVQSVTALFGTLAMQGTVQEWVYHHRLHHRGSDTPRDPHNSKRGFWFSHWGWILNKNRFFEDANKMNKATKDIMESRWLRFLSQRFIMVACQILLGFILYALGGISCLVWGVFVRLVLVYHTTWLVNSATHKWGYKNFNNNDLAVNTWWVAILTWGEGWHNNHHKYANVCPTWYRWWEVDITYIIIKFLEIFGLTYDIKNFPKETTTVSSNATHGPLKNFEIC